MDSQSIEEPLSHGSKKVRIIYMLDEGPLFKMEFTQGSCLNFRGLAVSLGDVKGPLKSLN